MRNPSNAAPWIIQTKRGNGQWIEVERAKTLVKATQRAVWFAERGALPRVRHARELLPTLPRAALTAIPGGGSGDGIPRAALRTV